MGMVQWGVVVGGNTERALTAQAPPEREFPVLLIPPPEKQHRHAPAGRPPRKARPFVSFTADLDGPVAQGKRLGPPARHAARLLRAPPTTTAAGSRLINEHRGGGSARRRRARANGDSKKMATSGRAVAVYQRAGIWHSGGVVLAGTGMLGLHLP